MALSFKDAETDALARQVASLTGETLTEAVRRSLAERLRNEQIRRGRMPFDREAVRGIIERFAALPMHDTRSDDEIVGYDENGLPTLGHRHVVSRRNFAE